MNFDLPAGDSRLLEITIYEEDGSTPADISGATVRWAAKRRGGSETVILTEASGLTVVDAAAGRVDVAIPKGTISIKGPWDHELEIVSGEVSRTPLRGVINVLAAIMSEG